MRHMRHRKCMHCMDVLHGVMKQGVIVTMYAMMSHVNSRAHGKQCGKAHSDVFHPRIGIFPFCPGRASTATARRAPASATRTQTRAIFASSFSCMIIQTSD